MLRKQVEEVLPRFAKRLQQEGLIIDYNRNPFRISINKDFPSLPIKPDAVFIIPGNRKILVEVTNPKDPKRFLGEFCYTQILPRFQKDIVASIILTLPTSKASIKLHQKRHLLLGPTVQVIESPKCFWALGWHGNDEEKYHNQRATLRNILRLLQIDTTNHPAPDRSSRV
jgi:hypothetical protein